MQTDKQRDIMNDVNLNLLLKLCHCSGYQGDTVPGGSMLKEAQFQRKICLPSLPHTEVVEIKTNDGCESTSQDMNMLRNSRV